MSSGPICCVLPVACHIVKFSESDIEEARRNKPNRAPGLGADLSQKKSSIHVLIRMNFRHRFNENARINLLYSLFQVMSSPKKFNRVVFYVGREHFFKKIFGGTKVVSKSKEKKI